MRGASGKKRVVRLVRVTRSERVVYAIRAGAGSHAYELVRTVLSAPPPWSTHGLRGGLDGGSSGGEGGNAAGCARAGGAGAGSTAADAVRGRGAARGARGGRGRGGRRGRDAAGRVAVRCIGEPEA